MTEAEPPVWVIDHAIAAARASSCAKSRRGVAVYELGDRYPIAAGFNGPPPGVECGVDGPCGGGAIKVAGLSACSMVCVHAEARALRRILGSPPWFDDLHDFGAVHVKVHRDGLPVPGGGPSCWQCAREILDVRLGAIWLWELEPGTAPLDRRGAWRSYTADQFFRSTLIACGLQVAPTVTPLRY